MWISVGKAHMVWGCYRGCCLKDIHLGFDTVWGQLTHFRGIWCLIQDEIALCSLGDWCDLGFATKLSKVSVWLAANCFSVYLNLIQ